MGTKRKLRFLLPSALCASVSVCLCVYVLCRPTLRVIFVGGELSWSLYVAMLTISPISFNPYRYFHDCANYFTWKPCAMCLFIQIKFQMTIDCNCLVKIVFRYLIILLAITRFQFIMNLLRINIEIIDWPFRKTYFM